MKNRSLIVKLAYMLSNDIELKKVFTDFITFLMDNYLQNNRSVDYVDFISHDKMDQINDGMINYSEVEYKRIIHAIEEIEANQVREDENYNGVSFYIELHLSNMINFINEGILSKKLEKTTYKSIPLDSLHYIGNNDSKPVKDPSFAYHLLHL
jgi:hypothetical protein